ncbi:MAG: TRAP transporter substrate-binding protein DctP [Burkholderiales bacterium]|nr:TRAP transporter substrate-binding protein DctP [Burkholderiales bacterium]MDE2394092.1 TRAP transporter substrate-binding protein DctP [Burkholderiales bacterium]MDE2456171.1 TRAP transporter substrate-binding protein DctP [Burkholderiales bacterium]
MFDFSRRRRCRRGLFLAAALFVLAAGAQAATTLVINAFLPPTDPFNVGVVKPWAADIEKATAGRVRIQFPPTSLAAPDQLWNSVRNSIVDGAYFFNGTVQGQLKLVQMAHLPFTSTSARANSIALWRTYEKFFAAADEYKDVHLLALVVLPSSRLYSLKQPLESTRDLQGHKVWALPGVPAKVMELAKAGVVSTPAAKMSEIVAGGTVDAFVGIPDMYAEGFKVIRYAKSATTIPGGIGTASFSLVINKQKWDSLPKADRDIITKLSGEAFAARTGALDEADAAAHQRALDHGLAYRAAAPAFVDEIRRIAAPIEQSWLADAQSRHVDGRAALDFYIAQSAPQP